MPDVELELRTQNLALHALVTEPAKYPALFFFILK